MQVGKRPVKSVVLSFGLFSFLVIGAAAFFHFGAVDLFWRSFALRTVENALGVKANARSVEIHYSDGSVEISDLVLYNPKGFPGLEMARIPRLYLEFSPRTFMTAKRGASRMNIEIKTVTVVRNQFKVLNIMVLPVRDDSRFIESLRLTLREIVFVDYSSGEEPMVATLPVTIDASYRNVAGLRKAFHHIVSEILADPAIARLDTALATQKKMPPPADGMERYVNNAAWTFEETAKGTASALFGGIRATTGKIADIMVPRTNPNQMQNRLGESYARRESAARVPAQ